MAMTPRYKILATQGGSTYDITEAVEMSEDEGVEATIDTFQFRIDPQNMPIDIEVDDTVKVYFGDDESTLELVMDGIVQDIKFVINIDQNLLTIKGMNRLERLLRVQLPAQYSGVFAGSAIKNLIDLANLYKADGGTDIDTSQIVTTGPAMPQGYYYNYKPVFQHIEKLSTNEFTASGDYVFWLDENNVFQWVNSTGSYYTDPVTKIHETEQDVLDFNISRSNFDVINAIIANIGDDKNENSITILVLNTTSMGLYGAKWKYMIRKEVEQEYRRTLSDAEYDALTNEEYRTNVKAFGKPVMQEVVDRMGEPRYKVDVTKYGTLAYSKGRTYNMVSTTRGTWTPDSPKRLRLKNIQHTFNMRGWFTTLNLQEDPETIASQV